MDGGELATDGHVVDDLLDGSPHLLHALNALVLEFIVHCEFALVTPGRATSGEISSDLYRLSGCDILNLTFCRLDFHQLLIKIS